MEDVSVKLQIDGANITTHPVFNDDVKLKITTENDQIFHRQSIEGTFKFLGEDFDIIEKCSDNITFTLSVYRGATLVGSATFVKADCEFDYDNKVCSVKLTTTDRYKTILGNMDNKYNLVKLAPEVKALTMQKRAVLQLYMMGDSKITNIIGNMSFESDTQNDAESKTLSELANLKFEIAIRWVVIDIAIDPNGGFSDFTYLNGRYYGRAETGNDKWWRTDMA